MSEQDCNKCTKEAEFEHINSALFDTKSDYKELQKIVADMMLSHQKTEWNTEQIKVTQDKMVFDNGEGFKAIALEKSQDRKAQTERDTVMVKEKKANTRYIIVAIGLMAVNLLMGLVVKALHWA